MSDKNSGSNSLYNFRADINTPLEHKIEHLEKLKGAHDYLFFDISIKGLAHVPEAINILTAAAETTNIAIEAYKESLEIGRPYFLNISKDPSCPAHYLHNMIVLDALFRGTIPFSISLDSSPTLDIYDLQLMVENNLKRPLKIRESHEISKLALEEGLPLDKMFLHPTEQIPYTSSVAFPSQLTGLFEEEIDVRLTAAPKEAFRSPEDDTVYETQNINMNHPSVMRITNNNSFRNKWKKDLEAAAIKDKHLMVSKESNLGQAINSMHCVLQAAAMQTTNKTNIVHIGTLHKNYNDVLLDSAQKAGFTAINRLLHSGNKQHQIIETFQKPTFLQSEQLFDHKHGSLNGKKYAEEMEHIGMMLSVLGLEDLFISDANAEINEHKDYIEEWAQTIAENLSGNKITPPSNELN